MTHVALDLGPSVSSCSTVKGIHVIMRVPRVCVDFQPYPVRDKHSYVCRGNGGHACIACFQSLLVLLLCVSWQPAVAKFSIPQSPSAPLVWPPGCHRCNFNSDQRSDFLALAASLQPACSTHAVVLHLPRAVCVQRAVARTDHPTGVQGPSAARVVGSMHSQLQKGGALALISVLALGLRMSGGHIAQPAAERWALVLTPALEMSALAPVLRMGGGQHAQSAGETRGPGLENGPLALTCSARRMETSCATPRVAGSCKLLLLWYTQRL